jgi:hypothetical protein
MKPELKELIEEGIISEMEIVEFLLTVKKLAVNNVLVGESYDLIIKDFGLEENDGWVEFDEDTKYKFE